ncbi:ABC transporter permease [Clostridium sp. CM028]|uniref:ABC transporter permease n=1 Tax=unclassified Clostridium TaxID=2614128 RepID=UPI001C0C3ACC|nr:MULTISPECIES: ABC transporter permease [unclassified Clostridium]MBU3092811.1 ABC transporter permease [Clostridium sp. CF011]MBW9146093.1 ABC transporter permease [Clostridium sp. CM027]MBW9148250.1 ABC transporter permease [Clostridium sp. CM028]UVE41730.1 ABC transporter permease [Clostridium sp. CM027]WAG70732.1 ABC transporter permease [Clostridium sp. CF011]
MKKHISIENKLIPIVFQLIILFIWQIAVDKWKVPQYILPSPKDIISTLVNIVPSITKHIYATLYEALIGFAISILIALILAILMDNVKIIKKCIYPILVVSQTVPIIALAPLFIIWFGFGILPKIIVVVLVCFFPIVVSLIDGLESVDADMVNLLKTMGASKFQIFTMVKLPSSTVNFFSGLRIAATYSIMGAVIGEWLGGDKGLGVYMIRAKNSYALDKVFAVIIIIVILSMGLFGLLNLLQYFFTPWTRNKADNND